MARLDRAIARSRVGLVQYGYSAQGDEAMEGLRRVIRDCTAPGVVDEAKARLATYEKS